MSLLGGLFGGGGFSGGGIGNSASAQDTKNFDQRVVGGDGSSNLSINTSGTTTLQLTDAGAINASLQLAAKGIEAVQQTAAVSLGNEKSLLDGVLSASQASNEQLADSMRSIQNKDTTTLIVAGMVLFGVVAAFAFPRLAKG